MKETPYIVEMNLLCGEFLSYIIGDTNRIFKENKWYVSKNEKI